MTEPQRCNCKDGNAETEMQKTELQKTKLQKTKRQRQNCKRPTAKTVPSARPEFVFYKEETKIWPLN